MTDLTREHYSHRFCFRLNRVPTSATDRFSRLILLIGLIAGVLLCVLGLFHFMPDLLVGKVDMEQNMPKAHTGTQSPWLPDVFNGLIVLTGLGLILTTCLKWYNCKKITFDGKNFKVVHRCCFAPTETFEEPLHHYTGVRLRVRFYQFGLSAKNKFIVELYHSDAEKIIPLYVTMRRKGIRMIWQNYARMLRMPGITISEKGMVSHNFKDLQEPYSDVVAKWHLPENFAYRLEKPSFITFKSRQTGEKMIKISKCFFDVLSVFSMLSIGIVLSFLVFALANHQVLMMHLPLSAVLVGYASLILLIIRLLAGLTLRDVIFIARDNIYLFRKILGIKMHVGTIPIRTIRGIDINYTPTSDRYYLFIATAGNNYIIGNKMPVGALRWLRAMLVNEIIGN